MSPSVTSFQSLCFFSFSTLAVRQEKDRIPGDAVGFGRLGLPFPKVAVPGAEGEFFWVKGVMEMSWFCKLWPFTGLFAISRLF